MHKLQFHLNESARSASNYRGLFDNQEYERVKEFFSSRPRNHSTPLRHLRELATEFGVADILLKDESERFRLNAFKILGVSYAVRRMLDDGELAEGSVVACATEGNHGRALARVAAENRLEAKVYVSSHTAPARIKALEEERAHVVLVEGNYDDAVRQAKADTEAHGWTIVSDTAWPGYERVPRLIMAGYTRLLDEAEEEWKEAPPDVVLVQAGVGGLACAVVSWLCWRYGARRPFTIVCEDASAECLLESTRAGEYTSLPGPFDTIMAGLRCGEASSIAWPVLAVAADAFVSVNDEYCVEAVRLLASPLGSDERVAAGASGACGLAALLAILRDESLSPVRESSGLGADSRVFVINTEGVTDPSTISQTSSQVRPQM
jgi:diaminopropionate ammonia-lyase